VKSGFGGSHKAVAGPSLLDRFHASIVPNSTSTDFHARSDRESGSVDADIVDFTGLDLVRRFDRDRRRRYGAIARLCAGNEKARGKNRGGEPSCIAQGLSETINSTKDDG
jgi:hypothetical protein